MAGKANFVQLFLDKGEKFLLFGALGLAGLLLVIGVLAMTATANPTEEAKTLANKASSLSQKINDPTVPANAPPLPEPAVEFKPIPYSDFQSPGFVFETTVWPDLRRENPLALTPVDDQVDLVLGSVIKLAREFPARKPGEDFKDFKMAVREPRSKGDIEVKNIIKLNEPKNKSRRRPPPLTGQAAPPGGGAGPGGGIGFPGGGLSRGGPPGGIGGFPGSGGIGGQLFTGGKTTEEVIRWTTYTEWERKPEGIPAYSVYPIRMGVVHLSFPLERQLEEIKKALRLRTMQETIVEAGPEQMRVKHPDTGKTISYAEYQALFGNSITTSGLGGPAGLSPGGPPGIPTGLPGGIPTMTRPAGGSSGGPPNGIRPGGPGGILPGGENVRPGAPIGGPGGEGAGSQQLTLTAAVAAPVFAGFQVERREVNAEGKTTPWYPFDHLENYNEEFELYEAKTIPEGGYMPNFLRPEPGQDMAYPLPELAQNYTVIPQEPLPAGLNLDKPKYPIDIRLPDIVQDWKSLEAAKVKPDTGNSYLDRLGKDRKPKSFSTAASSSGTTGISNIGGIAVGAKPNDPNKLPISHMLLRFVDTQLEPGATYQYRVKVRYRNPNFGKPDKMADEKQAEIEFIDSSFYELKHNLHIPTEDHIYAFSAKSYEEEVNEILKPYQEADRERSAHIAAVAQLTKLYEVAEVKAYDPRQNKKTVVQIQKWLPQLVIGEAREPIGGWVEAEIPVGIGEYVGNKVLVPLPLWRANEEKHTLTPPPKTIISGWPRNTTTLQQPLGRPVDFSTKHILLDFEGGKTQARLSTTSNPIADESMTELLILRDDGRIEVRKEAVDTVDPKRVSRQTSWKEWVKNVKEATAKLTTTAGPAFPGRGPGGGGGGGD